MRARTATLAGLVALTIVSVQAAPLFKAIPGEPGAGPSIELVRQAADGVAHRVHWRNRCGDWHWGL